MNRFGFPISVALTTIAGLAASAPAAITSVSGSTTQIGAPVACGPTVLANFNAYAWDELSGAAYTGPTDMTNNPANNGTAIPGFISGVYDSHFIHFEGIPGIIGVQGTVTFNAPIVAVMFNQPNLDISDAPLGAGGTAYPTGYPLRGLSAASTFSISGNTLNFLLVSTVSPNDIEQIRVLTQVPAPGVASAFALAGLAAARRRRR